MLFKSISIFIISFFILNLNVNACENTEDQNCKMIEVSNGVSASKTEMVQAIIAIESNFNMYSDSQYGVGKGHYVIANLKAKTSVDGNLLDIQFESFVAQYNTNENQIKSGEGNLFIQGNFLKLNVSKDVNLDLDKKIRLNVIGISIGGEYKPTEDLKLYALATLDIFSTGLARRMTDMTTIKGYGGGASFEIAATYKEKYKLNFGIQSENLKKKIASDTYYSGYDSCSTHSVDGYCNSYSCSYDDYGNENCTCTDYVSTQDETICDPIYNTDNYYQRFNQTKVYAQFIAKVSKHLSIYAGLEYSKMTFKDVDVPDYVTDPRTTSKFEDSKKSKIRFNTGMVYRF